MRKLTMAVLLLILCMVVSACGGNNAGNANTGDSGAAAPAGTSGTDSSSEPAKNEKLIVYTNANSDGRGEWLIEQAKSAGFDIEIVGAGGADLTNRLIAEKNNPIADVVYGLNNMLYENLKKEDVLAKFVPSWAGDVEQGLNDPEGYYHGLVKQAILLGYNPNEFTADTAPKDWTDLYKNDAFKGKYEAPTLLGQNTPRLVVAGILTRFQDPNGDLGISEEGWNEIQQLYDNVNAVEGEDYANRRAAHSLVKTGKIPAPRTTRFHGYPNGQHSYFPFERVVLIKGPSSPSVRYLP
nr:ABC transporter substrate-binding protein [Paenibacillus ihbetae]